MPGKELKDAEGSGELRRKAEELASRKEAPARSRSTADVDTLIHELEVHQIELELQNEELRRAQFELKSSRDRYADLFEFAPVGYFMLDRHFKVLEANLTGCRILDAERHGLLGDRFTRFVMPAGQDAFYRWMKTDSRKDGNSCELEMHRLDGTTFFAELKVVKESHKDAVALYRVAITDITTRKVMEDALKHSRDELELRVKERTRELSQTVLKLHERSEQLRRMTVLLTLAEQRERQRLSGILHDGLQQILVGAKYRLAFIDRDSDVHQAANEVAEIIDDAIETSRSLTAELSPPVLLTGNFVAALEWLANWMKNKHGLDVNLVVHRRIKPLITEANLLLFQAVRELLFNVVKHSGVKSARTEVDQIDGQIIVKLEDGGAGFDVSQIQIKKGESGGTGLLSIQERISYIGGSLKIDSALGRGSRFTLIAPIPKFSGEAEWEAKEKQARISVMIAPELEPEPMPARAIKRIRIMLVDDHLVMRQGLAGLLRGEPDFEIVGEASDGDSAVNLARDIRPDIILMDISMPGMDGVQATRIIHQELRQTCVIGLSMFQEPEREAAIREAGAVGYITKSGPAEAVIEAIRACVSAA
jgi:PAS domain S-box-containing protein